MNLVFVPNNLWAALLAHTVPGHHFQLSIAQGLKTLPFFRRVVSRACLLSMHRPQLADRSWFCGCCCSQIPFTAYIEGWGLYSEQLAAEEGFQEDPLDRIGYLDAQLMR